MPEQKSSKGARTTETEAQGVNLLEQIVDNFTPNADLRGSARDIIADFARQVLDGAIVYSKDTETMVKARISQLDKLISDQLNEVMHAPEFQKLEGSWRGLHYLVHQSETSPNLKIKVMNVAKKDLLKDLERAPEFDQSAIFKKVYEEEYGVFGGQPFGLLVGDYEIANHPQDLSMLEKMAGIAAAAHAPFISAADPKMLDLPSFTQLESKRDISKIFDSVEFTKWRSFRESDDSKYVGLCLPHVLMRLPYGEATVPVESFSFEEDVDGTDHSKYLWGNAAYAFAARTTDAFAQYGWCTAIRGVEGGGLVEGLPTHTFRTDEGDVALKCPTELQIGDRREKELADAGFIPLVHCKGRDYAAFFSVQSAQKPKKFDQPAATANARLTSQLQNTMAVARFAHYMKAIARDKVGSFMSRQNCEDFLNRWITQYVLLDDNAGQFDKARLPLREARVVVEEIAGKPGCYRAVAHLRPHFQLDELDVSLRLVADLPESKR
ncbi:MAG: type VI secretion system contractile sheath large subunit [Vicinamibacterales bacterium]